MHGDAEVQRASGFGVGYGGHSRERPEVRQRVRIELRFGEDVLGHAPETMREQRASRPIPSVPADDQLRISSRSEDAVQGWSFSGFRTPQMRVIRRLR